MCWETKNSCDSLYFNIRNTAILQYPLLGTEPTKSPRYAWIPVSLPPQTFLPLPNGLMNKAVMEGGWSYLGSETRTFAHDD